MSRRLLVAGLSASLGYVLSAGSGVAQDTAPDWIRQPTREQIMSAWPVAALKAGKRGRAVLTCEVSASGALRKCRVVEESPPGLGFGQAALNMATAFQMKPATRNGQPVSSEVTIPVEFDTPSAGSLGSHIAGGGKKVAILNRPVWLRAPSRTEVAAAHPKSAGEQAGRAVLECRAREDGSLTRCSVVSQQPRGRGFGGAAMSLVDRFQLAPMPVGQTVSDVLVRVPVQFDRTNASDLGGARLAGNPNWSQLPTAARVAALFPEKATAAGVREGRAVLDCQVAIHGHLVSCRVDEETPPGLGFGDAALKLSAGFALAPWTEDGRPVDGSSVRIPIRYVAPK